MDMASFALTQREEEEDENGTSADMEYRKQLSQAMNVPVNPKQSRILSYKSNKPNPAVGRKSQS